MDVDIIVSEVGPRDGLQSIRPIMPTEAKKQWIRAQLEAGTREIEVGSFVPPQLLPQMAATAEVARYAATLDGLTDTNLGTPTANQVLAYNAVASKWEPSDRIDTLTELTDVTAPTPADGQVLAWSAAASQWGPSTVSAAGTIGLNGLSCQGRTALCIKRRGPRTTRLQTSSTTGPRSRNEPDGPTCRRPASARTATTLRLGRPPTRL